MPSAVYDEKFWGMIDVLTQGNIVQHIPLFGMIEGRRIEPFALKIYRAYLRDAGPPV